MYNNDNNMCVHVQCMYNIMLVFAGGFALVFQVKAGRGQRYALKRMAVNSEQDLFIARQEIAITVSL